MRTRFPALLSASPLPISSLANNALDSLLIRCAQIPAPESVGTWAVFAAFLVGQRFHA